MEEVKRKNQKKGENLDSGAPEYFSCWEIQVRKKMEKQIERARERGWKSR